MRRNIEWLDLVRSDELKRKLVPLVEAFELEDDLCHVGEVAVQKNRQLLCVQLFRNRGKAADVAEHDGDFGFARLDELRIQEQAPDDFRAQILSERAPHAPLLFFLDQRTVQ